MKRNYGEEADELKKMLIEPLTKRASAYDIFKTRQATYTHDQIELAVEWLLEEIKNDERIWEYCPLAKEKKIKYEALKLKIKDAFPIIYPRGRR